MNPVIMILRCLETGHFVIKKENKFYRVDARGRNPIQVSCSEIKNGYFPRFERCNKIIRPQ